jgi:phosphatidate cytidylyltransferase
VTPKVNKGKLQTRVLSALTLGAFGLFVTCTGGWVWAMWMAGASYLASKEYFTMVPNMQSELPHPPPKWAGDASIFLCTIFALVLQACGAKTSALVMTTLAAFGVVAFLLTTRQDEPHFSQYTATLFGIVYCGALPSFWVKLRALAYSKSATIATGASGSRFVEAWPAVLGGPEAWTTGLIVTVITVSCIIASDVGAYAFGKTFGKTQLIKISPNKTVEGAAGGLLCTMLTAFGLRQLLGWHAGVIQTVALGALIFWAAVAGDLMESVMKRNAGMKDSGDIIPGHGGFLDRFDSYMFTGISVYFYIVTVMPHWFQGLVL